MTTAGREPGPGGGLWTVALHGPPDLSESPDRGPGSTTERGGATTRPALLLVGHGSQSADGVAECAALASRVRALDPGLRVATGFIELNPPPISEAAAGLVRAGARAVVVIPLVLLGAGHAKTDVPASVHLARRDFPGTRFVYGAPLGLHPDLLAVVDDRLGEAVPAAERGRTAVVVVGRGSSDPDANADLHKVARLLWEGRDWPLVEPAFVSVTGPRVPEALERCRRLGASRVVVVPYFLFTGVLERRIHQQARAFAAGHPEVAVTVARYLGVDDRVARLALTRYDEALRGEVRMSCDLCVHRAPMPGFADRVGLPLTPHHHPGDHRTHRHPPAGAQPGGQPDHEPDHPSGADREPRERGRHG
jgi:sirohydrochlorin cobaltochelatase